MTTLWRSYVDGADSEQIDNDCFLSRDTTQLVPYRNRFLAQVASADNSHDRSVSSILTPGYLPPAAEGRYRGRVMFPSTPLPFSLANNSSIYVFNNNAGSPIPVVDVYLDSGLHVNWFSEAGTLSAAGRDDHSTFVVAADTWYFIEFYWLGAAGGLGQKKLWINTDPALVGGANVPNINITGLTGTPANCVIGEARRLIDHLDGVQVAGYQMSVDSEQLSDGSAITDEVAPANTGSPTIDDTSPQVGVQITGDPGTWSGFGDFTFQWQFDDGGGPENIDGATAAVYTPTSDQIANTLIFTVTSTNEFGSVTASSAPTDAVTSGVPGFPAILATQPFLTGSPEVGITIGSSSGEWTSTLHIDAYQFGWLASPFPIIDLGVAGVPVSVGDVNPGGSTFLDDIPDLEIIGPFTVPHDQPIEALYMRYAGGAQTSHTRLGVYRGADRTNLEFLTISSQVVVAAGAPEEDQGPFVCDGLATVNTGDLIWFVFWTDGNIIISGDAATGGQENYYYLSTPYSPTGLPPEPFPPSAGVGSNHYVIYMADGAFAPHLVTGEPSQLTIDNSLLGEFLLSNVYAINAAGVSKPAYSQVIGPITLATYPVNIVAPFISAQPIVGVGLPVDPGEYFPDPTIVRYSWQSSLTPNPSGFSGISGDSFNSVYVPEVAGVYLRCAVFATGPGGTSPPYYSNIVGPVLDALPPAGSGEGPLPWLEFCGGEIVNTARTISYLRNGLADTQQGHFELGSGDVCGVLYRQLGGTCGSPDVFISPAADPAPWYDPRDRGSQTFLGMFMLGISGYDSVVARAVTNRISGLQGGVFGQQNRNARLWKFRAAMISSDGAGAEYGLRWLTHALEGACDGCQTCELKVRLFCPPPDCSDDEAGERTSYDVALIDGPHEVAQFSPRPSSLEDSLAGCRDVVIVEWTIAAVNPFLYERPVERMEITVGQSTACTDICDFLFGSPGDAHCAIVEPPLRGTIGSIFTITAGQDGIGGLLLESYQTCPGNSSAVEEPALQIELEPIPPGGIVTVDSAKHTITLTTTDPFSGAQTIRDAQDLIVLAPGRSLEWLEIRWCDDIHCFCVRPSAPCSQGQASVVLQTQLREG